MLAQIPVASSPRADGVRSTMAIAALTFVAACLLVVGADLVDPPRRAALLAAVVVVGVGECLHTTVLMPLVADLAPAALRGRYMAAIGLSWWLGLGAGADARGAAAERVAARGDADLGGRRRSRPERRGAGSSSGSRQPRIRLTPRPGAAPRGAECDERSRAAHQRGRMFAALVAGLVTVTLWGSAFVAIRDAGETLSPGSLALGRLLVSLVVLGGRRVPLARAAARSGATCSGSRPSASSGSASTASP